MSASKDPTKYIWSIFQGAVLISFMLTGLTLHAQLEEFTHLSESTEKKATHYRYPVFMEGAVLFEDGKEVKAKLNYNLATEEMVVDLGHRKMPYPANPQIVAYEIEGTRFQIITNGIYELVYEDQISLLLHGQCKLQRLGQNTGLGRSGTISSREVPPSNESLYELELPGTFEQRDYSTYYLRVAGELHVIDKAKEVWQLFPRHATDLKKFMKQQKIKMRKKDDLVKLTKKINQFEVQ